MPRFMIESSHGPDPSPQPGVFACLRALDAAVAQGSHYLTNAQFGCEDGVHKAWIFVEAEDRADARGIVDGAHAGAGVRRREGGGQRGGTSADWSDLTKWIPETA